MGGDWSPCRTHGSRRPAGTKRITPARRSRVVLFLSERLDASGTNPAPSIVPVKSGQPCMKWVLYDQRSCAQRPPEFLPDTCSAIHLGPRALPLQLPSSHVAAWLVLRGTLNGQLGDRPWTVAAREAIVWPEGAVRLVPGRNCWALGMVLPLQAWRSGNTRDVESPVLWQSRASHAMASALIRLIQTLRAEEDAELRGHAALVEAWAHQEPAQSLLHRCPGRTRQARRRTLSRLLRVRHCIQNDFDAGLRLDVLARQASYSAHHLVRLYRDVFGQTPSDHATSLRHQRAWELVALTPLSISDITAELGFDSRSAFCRAFKARYGVTATQAREGYRR
jgi:AraC family transcriptional regulator